MRFAEGVDSGEVREFASGKARNGAVLYRGRRFETGTRCNDRLPLSNPSLQVPPREPGPTRPGSSRDQKFPDADAPRVIDPVNRSQRALQLATDNLLDDQGADNTDPEDSEMGASSDHEAGYDARSALLADHHDDAHPGEIHDSATRDDLFPRDARDHAEPLLLQILRGVACFSFYVNDQNPW